MIKWLILFIYYLISKKPGHVAENCYNLTKVQEAVSNKQNSNFGIQNQQRSNNYKKKKILTLILPEIIIGITIFEETETIITTITL